MNIEAFPSGPFETNAYVISCQNTNSAAIIDPAPDSAPSIISYIKAHNLVPQMIILTHSHWDHIADTSTLLREYSIPVYIHPLDALNLRKPGSDGLPCWLQIEGVEPDKELHEGEIISIGMLNFTVIETPGHTPGGICLYNKEKNILISGDTLFKGSIGNLSFPTARPNLMWESLAKLAKLPAETKVYPGHGPETSIKAESWISNAKQIFNY